MNILREIPREAKGVLGSSMIITVEELLANVTDGGLRCVAGYRGLGNKVRGFNMVDAPDIAKWINPGDFVVSYGYVTTTLPEVRKALISDLAAKGAAGLGIKLHAYYKAIPDEYIRLGNELDFPVIAMPYNLRFSDMAYHIYKNIFQRNMSASEQTYHIFQKLSSSIFAGNSIEHILYDIGKAIENPVILTNTDFEVIGYEIPRANAVNLEQYLMLKKNRAAFTDAVRYEIAANFDETHFTINNIVLDGPGSPINTVLMSINFGQKDRGFLIIPQTMSVLSGETYIAVENILSILGLYFVLYEKGFANENSADRTFFGSVLDCAYNTKSNIHHYCNLYGFDQLSKRVCLDLFVRDQRKSSFVMRVKLKNMIEVIVGNTCCDLDIPFYFLDHEDHFIFFLFFPNEVSDNRALEKAKTAAERIMESLSKYKIDFYIGVSGCSKDITQIPTAYKQVLGILEIGQRLRPESAIYTYESLKSYYALYNTLSFEDLRYLSSVVMPLADMDREENSEYLKTLEAYINNRFNVTKSANELFIHRNSMIYRLNRIREKLSVDVDDPEQSFNIQMGLRALRLLECLKHRGNNQHSL